MIVVRADYTMGIAYLKEAVMKQLVRAQRLGRVDQRFESSLPVERALGFIKELIIMKQ